MTLPIFPATDLDTPATVQSLLGSFWSATYDGWEEVRDYVAAVCMAYRQAGKDLDEAQKSIVWRNVPLLHVVEWYPLTVLASERLDANLTGLRYSSTSTATYGNAGAYGQPLPGAIQPAALGNVVDAVMLFDGITTPNACLTRDVDFTINTDLGAIEFLIDPFADPRFQPTPIFDTNGNQTDSELVLWLYQASFDERNLQTQIGYVFGLDVPSTAAGQDLVTALLNAIEEGTSRKTVEALFEAVCGVKLACGTETVQVVTTDARGLLIVTSANAYRFPSGANALVTVGQVVNEGDALADSLQFLDLNNGQIPEGLTALAVGPALLEPGYQSDLIFPNIVEPLQVTTDLPTGRTKVSAALGGYPPDVAKFWSDVHSRGVAANQTLANLLDTRTNPVGEPTVANLPTTFNPLQFLVANVLRCGVAVVQVSVAGMSPSGLGMPYLRYLRRIVPPLELVQTIATMPPFQDLFTITDTDVLGQPCTATPDLSETGSITLPTSDPISIWPQNY